ncbi:MAG: hypothetical protein KC656_21615, partial [Myxococcales bacterium]|nr:hypothetical protein [Myxococcales bacterium]
MRVLPSASSLACLSWLVLAACETAPQPDDKSGKDDTDAGDSADASGIPAPQLAFEPAAPVTADDIVLVVGNQGTYDVFVDWRSDGQQQTAFRNVLTIPAANTAKGQTWQATVTLRRGDAVGPPAMLSVEIGNTAPTVTLTIQPEAPTASDSLRLEVLQDDPDGDPLERSVSWTKNGRDFNPGATPEAIAASFLERGDTWAVVLEVRDPDGAVAEARDEVVVGNSPPVVTTAALSPLTPDTTATLTGRVVRQDPDGDVGLVDTIEWFVRSKGTTTSVLKGDALQLDAQASRAGDEVWFTVSVSDGLPGGVSAPVESNHVIIRNTAPLIETVAVSPEAPTVRAAISCVPSGWTDIDGDPEGYRYSWTKDGVLIPGADQAQLPPSAFARGDSIACTATPFDGTSAGQPVGSEPVEVRNALPYLNSVAVSPGAPGVKTELVAVLDPPEGIDPDGDTVSFRYQWQAWGENIAGASGATLPGPHKAKDRIRVVVTPYDSFGDDGLDVPSGLLEIGNVRPVVTDVQIDPASPTVNSILKAIPVASDADDQP